MWDGLVSGEAMGETGQLADIAVYPGVTGCWFLRSESDDAFPGVPEGTGSGDWPDVAG